MSKQNKNSVFGDPKPIHRQKVACHLQSHCKVFGHPKPPYITHPIIDLRVVKDQFGNTVQRSGTSFQHPITTLQNSVSRNSLKTLFCPNINRFMSHVSSFILSSFLFVLFSFIGFINRRSINVTIAE